MKKIFFSVLIFVFSSILITDCKKDKGDAPNLPPAESLSIDFSNFSSAKKSLELLPDQKGTSNSNWEFAATVAGVWKLILTTTLALPVSAFEVATNQNPVFVSGKTWQWSYNVTYLNVTYKVRLVGQIASDIQWKMYVSKDGTDAFAEYLWIEGTSKTDGTGGTWTINQEPKTGGVFLQIDWAKTDNVVGNIKYTYLKPGSFKDSYIQYGLTADPLNAFYTIHYYNGTKFSDVNVAWI